MTKNLVWMIIWAVFLLIELLMELYAMASLSVIFIVFETIGYMINRGDYEN